MNIKNISATNLRWILSFAISIGLIVFMIVGFIRGAPQSEDGDGNRAILRTVDAPVISVAPENRPVGIFISGELQAWKTTDILAKSSGTVVTLIQGGGLQSYKKGARLVYLENDGSASAYQQAKSNYDRAQLNLETMTELYESEDQLISRSEFLGAQSSYDQARSELESANQRRENSNVSLPFDAWVSDVFVETGSFVSPGTLIARAHDLSYFRFVAQIPAKFFPYIRKGQMIEVEVPMLSSGNPNKILKGSIISIDAEVSGQTQSFSVHARIENTEGIAPLNQTLRATIEGPKLSVFDVDLAYLTHTRDGRPAVRALSDEQSVLYLPIFLWQGEEEDAKMSFTLADNPNFSDPISIFSRGSAFLSEGQSVNPIYIDQTSETDGVDSEDSEETDAVVSAD